MSWVTNRAINRGDPLRHSQWWTPHHWTCHGLSTSFTYAPLLRPGFSRTTPPIAPAKLTGTSGPKFLNKSPWARFLSVASMGVSVWPAVCWFPAFPPPPFSLSRVASTGTRKDSSVPVAPEFDSRFSMAGVVPRSISTAKAPGPHRFGLITHGSYTLKGSAPFCSLEPKPYEAFVLP